MLVTCWSAKGGSGTTVVAASIALLLAQRGRRTALVDLVGDSPACLGVPEPLDASSSVREVVVHEHLCIKWAHESHRSVLSRWSCMLASLDDTDATVVDAGVGEPPEQLRAASTHSLVVTRACYLAMRHLCRVVQRPSGVILINEPGRALGRSDIEAVAGAPVIAEIAWDPTVARTVDAGLLAGRLPRPVCEALRTLPWIR